MHSRAEAVTSAKPVIRLGRSPFPFLAIMSVGFLFWYQFNLVGTMYAIELALALIAIGGLLFGFDDPGFAPKTFQSFFGLLLVAFCAYVTTDLLHGTAMHDALRAWARIVFLGLDALGLWVLCRRSLANFLPLFVGIFIGYMLFEFHTTRFIALYWKFGMGVAMAGFLLSLIGLFAGARAVLFTGMLTGALALVSFVLDARAMGGVLALTSAFVLMKVFMPSGMKRMIPVFILITVLLAGSGIFIADRYFSSSRRDAVATIERAAAMVTGVQTIAENPLDGVGSWNSDFETANRHRANALRMGLRNDQETYRGQLGHSEVLQPWIEAGIFAALFFIFYGWSLIQSLRWILLRPLDRYTSLLLFYLLNESWNAAFSPFLGYHRIFMAIAIVMCILLAQEKAAAKHREPAFPGTKSYARAPSAIWAVPE